MGLDMFRSPFECLCGNFILPEFLSISIFLFFFEFAKNIIPYPAQKDLKFSELIDLIMFGRKSKPYRKHKKYKSLLGDIDAENKKAFLKSGD